MSYKQFTNSNAHLRGTTSEQEFDTLVTSKGYNCQKSDLHGDKVLHVDYWLTTAKGKKIGVDVKANRWANDEQTGCIEVPVKNKVSYDYYSLIKPASNAIYCSWSEAHTKEEEWLVFKMPDGYKVIERSNNVFLNIIAELAKRYVEEHPQHKWHVRTKYNRKMPYVAFGNQNATKAVWLMPVPLKDIEPFFVPLEEKLAELE